MHCEPHHVVLAKLDFPGVDSGSDVKLQAPRRRTDRSRGTDCTRRAVERCQNSIAGRFHQPTSELCNVGLDAIIVCRKQFLPAPVAHPRRPLGGIDDVGEQHGGEHALEFWLRSHPSKKFLHLVEHAGLVPDGDVWSAPGSST